MIRLYVWNESRRCYVFDCEADSWEEYRQLLAVQRHYKREGLLTKIEGNPSWHTN